MKAMLSVFSVQYNRESVIHVVLLTGDPPDHEGHAERVLCTV